MSAPAIASPRSAVRFSSAAWQWAVVAFSAGMFGGALLDAWSHVNIVGGDPVLNVWHLPVYGSFLALSATLALPVAGRLLRRRSLRTLVPASYRLAVTGGAIFLLAGAVDTLWHATFGIEIGTEALLSPSHLGLALGAAMLWSGPLVMAWRRRAWVGGWRWLPALLAGSLITGLVSFATHFAHPLVDPWPAFAFGHLDLRSWYVPNLGFAAMVIQSAVLMGAALMLLRRWPDAPLGTMTVLFTVSSAGLSLLHGHGWLMLVALVGGLAADALRGILRPSAERPAALRVFATATPVTLAVALVATVGVFVDVRWSVHLLTGLPVVAGATGLLVSLLVFPPAVPGARRSSGA